MEFVLQLQELEVSTENPAMNGGGYDSNASLLICE
jgi:Lanthionine-containing peptide SapB precursor RamS